MPRSIRRLSIGAETESTKISQEPMKRAPQEIWTSMGLQRSLRAVPIAMIRAPMCFRARLIDAATAWLRTAIET
jgi:hypothetical protein